MMVDKVYFLLDIRGGNVGRVVITLRRQWGVVMVDALEERPSIIALVEAESRQRLAQLAVRALASVEMMTEALSLMPVKADAIESSPSGKRVKEVVGW